MLEEENRDLTLLKRQVCSTNINNNVKIASFSEEPNKILSQNFVKTNFFEISAFVDVTYIEKD